MHLRTLGIEADQSDLQTIARRLRELTVQEFLGVRTDEYASYLNGSHRNQFEEMENNFENRGFFGCELCNPTPLALANILQVPLVIISFIENFPAIPIIPRETPLTDIPLYMAYQRVGAGHYDATIEAHHDLSAAPSIAATELRTESSQARRSNSTKSRQ